MNNLKRIKGLTLIEVMVLLTLFFGFILIFFNMDMSLNESQNSRKVGTQINMLASAVDKRISIEGKNFDYWKNGTSWNNGVQFRNFLRQELVGKNNTTCGDSAKGWAPATTALDLDGTTEGKNIAYLANSALKSKLIPCTFWSVYPYDIEPTVKIEKNTENNYLKSIIFSFTFQNLNDWKKYFNSFNKSFNLAKEQQNPTLLTTKEFYYSNRSGDKVDLKECLDLKQNCQMNLALNVGSSSTDDKKFKVDSSNNFETNLGFAKSITENGEILCNSWQLDSTTDTWVSKETTCGVTGGTEGEKEVSLVGENIDASNIIVNGECKDFSTNQSNTLNSSKANCGLVQSGTNSNLNVSKSQSNDTVAENLYSKDTHTNKLGGKDDSTIDSTIVDGKSATVHKHIAEYNDQGNIYDMNIFKNIYRDTMAESVFSTIGLNIPSLLINYDLNVTKTVKANSVQVYNKTNLEAPLNSLNYVSRYDTNINQLNSQNSTTVSDTTTVKDYGLLQAVTASNQAVIAGDVTANNIVASNKFETEQLHFKNSFQSRLGLNFSKSVSFDGLGDKYMYPKGYVSGWGALGYKSNGGIYAKRFTFNGNLNVNTTTGSANLRVSNDYWGWLEGYTGYRNGVTLAHDAFPDTRGMFYMNDAGKVMTTGFYETGPNTGVRIGTGFFWGKESKNLTQFNDKPIITNLSSSIYNYSAGDDITAINDGFKMITNNLTVNVKNGANFYSGAYYHKGMPKIMGTQTPVPIQYLTSPVGYYWQTSDGIYLSNLNSTINEAYNRMTFIYGQYVILNKKGFIGGTKGDRGPQGQTGIDGIRGNTGSQGIPGSVGLRGGE